MRFGLKGIIVCTAISAAAILCPSKAGAQNAPPDPIFNLVTTHPTVLSSYVNFTTSFVATSNAEYVSFAFRETPAYFAFDDASVALHGTSTNLLADPGFESASYGQNCNHNNSLGCPTGWGAWIQPVDTSAIGQVATNASRYGCGPLGAHSGTQFWCDGSVQGYDAVYQHLTGLTVGSTYDISWWLGDDSSQAPRDTDPGDQIDMLVYAGTSLPVGTVNIGTPEPGSLGLIGIGVISILAFALRRRALKIN